MSDTYPLSSVVAVLDAMHVEDLTPVSDANSSRFHMPARLKVGERHSTLFKLLRSQKARGMSLDATLAACHIENEHSASPLDRAELDAYLRRSWQQTDQAGFTGNKKQGTLSGRVCEEFRHYFVTQLGSKDGGRLITMVGHDEHFPPSFQSFEAFRQYYYDTRIKRGNNWTTRAQLWLEDKHHRKYTDVQFLPPPLAVPPTVLNLWNGFAVPPDPDPYPERRCELFLRHVREVICAGEDPNVAEFLLDVLAKKVQEPALLTEVSIVARGDQGAGKNTLTEYYGGMFGRHAATVDKQELVTGRFNAVLSQLAGKRLTWDELTGKLVGASSPRDNVEERRLRIFS